MRFFDAINRWQVVAATAVILAGIDFGIYHFSYLPDKSPAPGPSQRQDLTVPTEETAPKTVSNTPPPSKTQYRP
ncbi:MAG: hypothetical protein H0U55_09475 [Rubrobacteraceae bacterium]|nr:hypothetical protein [Rubrobacteraceae bacterium]